MISVKNRKIRNLRRMVEHKRIVPFVRNLDGKTVDQGHDEGRGFESQWVQTFLSLVR
jgi:hypothetical protein